GEIVAAGPQVMSGYWNAPDPSAATLRGGWLHTGDVGYVDEEGYVYLVDRKKDMIVTGGSNVYSVEVEKAVEDHPSVREVAVIGVPDERWGETVMAVVVVHEGSSLDLDELDAFCRSRLGGYKIPRRLEVVEELPRNPSGKVLKHELRRSWWPDGTRFIG
ncbi:MAG: AMP-binding protein, partial [Acidimicrobiales bacterium]|nr:AMP-binding protein [Acidimicrobiales bacterium]